MAVRKSIIALVVVAALFYALINNPAALTSWVSVLLFPVLMLAALVLVRKLDPLDPELRGAERVVEIIIRGMRVGALMVGFLLSLWALWMKVTGRI